MALYDLYVDVPDEDVILRIWNCYGTSVKFVYPHQRKERNREDVHGILNFL